MVWRAAVLDRGAIYRHGPGRLVGAGEVPDYLLLPFQRERKQDHEQDDGPRWCGRWRGLSRPQSSVSKGSTGTRPARKAVR